MKYPILQPVELLDAREGAFRVRPKTEGDWRQTCDHVYAEALGVGLVMDVFEPTGAGNGRGIVDVVCGGWQADRVRLNEHLGLGLVDALCAEGFTVFAVSPGSASLFTGLQMVAHVRAAIRHVRQYAAAWGVAAEPLGLAGASAGGHIAALAALAPDPAEPSAREPWRRHGTAVEAVGCFFPPTDLLDFDGGVFDFAGRAGRGTARLLFEDGLAGHDEEAVRAAAEALSPARQVRGTPPPFLLIHGDADPVVHLSQSEKLRDALLSAGGEAELWVKRGGRHPWQGVRAEAARLASWFAARLA